jgi:hypothetical protein
MFLAAYVSDVNTTPETVRVKFGDCGGHSAIFSVCLSACHRSDYNSVPAPQPVDSFGSTCQLRDILRMWGN